MTADVVMIKQHLIYGQVCVRRDLTDDEIDAQLPPTGITSSWRVIRTLDDMPEHPDGHPNPVYIDCETDPARQHRVVSC